MEAIPVTHCGPRDERNFEFEWEGSYLKAHLVSDIGWKRSQNEDACLVCAPEDPDVAAQKGLLFAVADGMGGVRGGGFASKAALDTLSEQYYQHENGNVPDALRHALEQANGRIFQEAETNSDLHGMGTTVTAMVIQGEFAYIAHVGDSRLYLSRDDNGVLQITDDHSFVAEQVRSGMITEEEARTHVLKNLITRAVGTKNQIQIDMLAMQLKARDTLLICSDGLSNMVDEETIASALRMKNLKGAARTLVGKALDEGGSDNVTAALVRVVSEPPHSTLERGARLVSFNAEGFLARLKRLFST